MNMKCDVCGVEGQPIPIVARTGDIVQVCQQGHFEGMVVHAYSGLLHRMVGDPGDNLLPVNCLLWFPEGWVPSLWNRLWAKGGRA